MSQTIQIKRSTGTAVPSSLSAGELAYSFKSDTKKLYIGDGSNVITIGGQAFTDKLDGIEAGADVTDATNVNAAGAVMNSDTSTASMSFVIDENNMSSDSDTKVPTQQSVKAYVDTEIGNLSTGVSSVSGTAPIVSSGGASPAISISLDDVTVEKNTSNNKLQAKTAAVADNETALATGDQIHDFVTGLLGDFTFSGGEISSTQSTITIDPSVNGPSGIVVIDGSLEVKGTTTTVDSTTVTLADNIIRLNKDYSSAPSGTATYGIELNRGTPTDGTQTLVSFLYNETGDKWTVETKNGTHNEIIHTGNSASATYTLDGGTF
jgi:hypothetical protein|tara:strand:+ start:468 stop:1430 length:963 start_codon:yes stop_codon:yes gene_type:complete